MGEGFLFVREVVWRATGAPICSIWSNPFSVFGCALALNFSSEGTQNSVDGATTDLPGNLSFVYRIWSKFRPGIFLFCQILSDLILSDPSGGRA